MEHAAEQPAVHVRRQTWEPWAPQDPGGYEIWMSALELATDGVTRADVVAAAREHPLMVVPLAAMWGSGSRARAIPKNVGLALERPATVERALDRMISGIHHGPETAFESLWTPDDFTRPAIRGFGTSFGTKLLSFLDQALTQRGERIDAPLIYDLMVCRALAATGARWPEGMPGSGPPTFDPPTGCVRFASYGSYCRLAALAADRADCDPRDVEYTLFRLGQELGPGVELPPSGCGSSGGREAFDDGHLDEHIQRGGSFRTNVQEVRELLTGL